MAKRNKFDKFWTVMARISITIALSTALHKCSVKLQEHLQTTEIPSTILLPVVGVRRCRHAVIKKIVREQINLNNNSPNLITIMAADEAFYTAHPERNRKPINPEIDSPELIYEWKIYKDEAYWCYLEMDNVSNHDQIASNIRPVFNF